MYKVGIIGCGRIASIYDDCHVRAYKECEKTEIKALCDINIGKAYDCAEKWKLDTKFYYKASELRDVDIVSICTLPESHLSVLKDIIDLDLKAVYCEKPIADTVEHGQEMINLCRSKGIVLQVNHQRRFGIPTFSFARGLFVSGTHVFDLLRMYFGDIKFEGNYLVTPNGLKIEIIYKEGSDYTFDFKVPVPSKGLIRLGVEHLIDCIENKHESISSGEESLEALKLCWEFKKLKDVPLGYE